MKAKGKVEKFSRKVMPSSSFKLQNNWACAENTFTLLRILELLQSTMVEFGSTSLAAV